MRIAILLAIAAVAVFGQEPAAPQAKTVQVVALQAQIAALQADLAAAQAKLTELSATYTDSAPDVLAAQKNIAVLKAQLAVAEKQLARYQALASAGIVPGAPAAQSPKLALPGRWWRNPVTVQFLGLSADQQKKMDDVVAQYRQKLAENNYELERQQKILTRMVAIAEAVNETDTAAQIDRVADARAELEKTNGRMLLGIRKLLTPEQWTKLNQSFTLSLTQKEPTR